MLLGTVSEQHFRSCVLYSLMFHVYQSKEWKILSFFYIPKHFGQSTAAFCPRFIWFPADLFQVIGEQIGSDFWTCLHISNYVNNQSQIYPSITPCLVSGSFSDSRLSHFCTDCIYLFSTLSFDSLTQSDTWSELFGFSPFSLFLLFHRDLYLLYALPLNHCILL